MFRLMTAGRRGELVLEGLTSFINRLRNGGVVVFYCVLSQLESIQTTDRLISSGPIKHDIVDVVSP